MLRSGPYPRVPSSPAFYYGSCSHDATRDAAALREKQKVRRSYCSILASMSPYALSSTEEGRASDSVISWRRGREEITLMTGGFPFIFRLRHSRSCFLASLMRGDSWVFLLEDAVAGLLEM